MDYDASGVDESFDSDDEPFDISSQMWFIYASALFGLLILVTVAVVIIISCRKRVHRRRRRSMIVDKDEHDSEKVQASLDLNAITGFSNVCNFDFSSEVCSFTGGGGGGCASTSSSNLSENTSTSIAQFSHVSQASNSTQLYPQEDSSTSDNRNSVIMDCSELRPLSLCPPQRRRSRRSDYDRLEKIPESMAESGKLFVFLPSEPVPEDDDVFKDLSSPEMMSPLFSSDMNDPVAAEKSLPRKRDSSTYEDASSTPYPENAHTSTLQESATETVDKTPDHYSIPSEFPPETTTVGSSTGPSSTARPQSSIYTSIDEVDVELPLGRRTSLPLLTTTQPFTLSLPPAATDTDRPMSSIYSNIDDVPDSFLPQRVPVAGERQSSIYTTIDETLPPLQSSAENEARQPHKEYSYATSLMLTSPKKTGQTESKDGEFRPVPDDHNMYTYIMDDGMGVPENGLEKNRKTHDLVYQNVPFIFCRGCEQFTQPRKTKFARSMSTPDILLSSTSYDEKPTTAESLHRSLESSRSSLSSRFSNSHSDLASLQTQEELEQYSAYYNASRIAGVGGWVVKNDKPVPEAEDQASGQNDDYHSDLSLWLTPEQRAYRSWSVGSSQDHPCLLQPCQTLPAKQAKPEGNYTKIFAREVQRHVYERPARFRAKQNSRSSTLGRPLASHSHKTPCARSYVNQLVWLSSNRPVYPQFHKPEDSDSHYTRLLPATELDDDGYTMPAV